MRPGAAIAILLVIILLGAGAYWYMRIYAPQDGRNGQASGLTDEQIALIGSFEECRAHFAVQESWPPRCSTPDGRTFAQDIGNELAKQDLITIDTPRPTATIDGSPLTISGKARGNWYFEASFPIELQDASGKVIAQHYAEAQGEWMTTEFVPFKATLTFPAQASGSRGKLILRKDNPSGLPENDDQLIVPIVFK